MGDALVKAGLWLSLVSGVLTLAVGVAHVSVLTEDLECMPGSENACVGMLNWRNASGGFTDDTNKSWRSFVTLQPDRLFKLWAPLFAGLATFLMHLSGDARLGLISSSWFRVSIWMLVNALFFNFGYAGRLGIAAGFISSTVAFLGLLIGLLFADAPTCLGLSFHLFKCLRCENDGARILGVITMLSALAASSLTFVVGWQVIVDRLPEPCTSKFQSSFPEGTIECVGTGLFWTIGESEPLDPINSGVIPGSPANVWSAFFSPAPSDFLENFTPFILGFFGLRMHLSARRGWVIHSWFRIMLWYLFSGLLVAGYSGNLGVLALFLCIAAACLAALMILLSDAEPAHLGGGGALESWRTASGSPGRSFQDSGNAPNKSEQEMDQVEPSSGYDFHPSQRPVNAADAPRERTWSEENVRGRGAAY